MIHGSAIAESHDGLQRKPFLTAEWRHLAMLNFPIDPARLEPLVPKGTMVDTYRGVAYISLVGFLFKKTKVLGIPLFFHQQFEEVNLRFYVRRFDGQTWRRGVVFVKEMVSALVISKAARFFYNENYFTCQMDHRIRETSDKVAYEYRWRWDGRWNRLAVVAEGKPRPIMAGSLEEFITHHEWGYTQQRDGGSIEYRVVHPCWEVASASETILECDAASVYGEQLGLALSQPPTSAFAIRGSAVKVYGGNRLVEG